jgi:hypothetical protein
MKDIVLMALLSFTPIASAVHGDKLNLNLGSIGYRWTQYLEGREGKNVQSAWAKVNINEHITLELTWKTLNIQTPFDDGDDRLSLDLKYSF